MEKKYITKYHNSRFTKVEDVIITESRLSVKLNGTEIAGLMTLPVAIDKLAMGYLFSECYFKHPRDIEQINTDVDNISVNITIAKEKYPASSDENRPMTIGSSKGIIRVSNRNPENYPIINSVVTHSAKIIIIAANQLSQRSTVFKNTGGVHSSGLWLDDNFLWFYDDIGRHNAVDKVIGHALMEQWPVP
ncbi:formate dehydrogenase accessory sulfurtransferase FdhD, partial [bacterium]|nr:formate dehydrogenase accessory sulfurtransferase FdhD [bacterium]